MILDIMFTSAFITLLLILILRPIVFKIGLVDSPNERKKHVGDVPLIGGVSIWLAVLVSYFFIIEVNKFSSALLLTASLILIQGIWDDFKNLKATPKLGFQVLVTLIMIYISDVKLNSLGYLFMVPYSIELNILSIPITIIAIVGLTNAINMIDGLDGLAGSLVMISMIGLLFFNLRLENSSFSLLLLAITASLCPFMIFNVFTQAKLKIFLGDSGSLFLGYIISWSLIYSAENESNFNPSFALWCVAIPLIDFFTVIIIRINEKRSLTVANKDHVHHFLENLGFSKRKVVLLILSSGILLLLIGKLIEDNFPLLSFPIFFLLFLLYLFIRNFNFSNKKIR